jgi:hypothetical protein
MDVSNDDLRKFLRTKKVVEIKQILRDSGVSDSVMKSKRKDELIDLVLNTTSVRSKVVDMYSQPSTTSSTTSGARKGAKPKSKGTYYYYVIYVIVNNDRLRDFFTDINLTKTLKVKPIYNDVIVSLLNSARLAYQLIVENNDLFQDLFFNNIDLLQFLLNNNDILQFYINNPEHSDMLKYDRFKDLITNVDLKEFSGFPNIYSTILSNIDILDRLHNRMTSLDNVIHNQNLLEIFNAYPSLFVDLILSDDTKYNTLLGLYRDPGLMSEIKNNTNLSKLLGLNPEYMYEVSKNIDKFRHIINNYSNDLNTILSSNIFMKLIGASSINDIDNIVSNLKTPKRQTVLLPPIRRPGRRPKPLSEILESMGITDVHNVDINVIDKICKEHKEYCTPDRDEYWKPLILTILGHPITLEEIRGQYNINTYLDFLKYILTQPV